MVWYGMVWLNRLIINQLITRCTRRLVLRRLGASAGAAARLLIAWYMSRLSFMWLLTVAARCALASATARLFLRASRALTDAGLRHPAMTPPVPVLRVT